MMIDELLLQGLSIERMIICFQAVRRGSTVSCVQHYWPIGFSMSTNQPIRNNEAGKSIHCLKKNKLASARRA
jgi:hypothetical protein